MKVHDFHRLHPCCLEGVEEGLKYEYMKDWWECTERADWMIWCWLRDKRTEGELRRVGLKLCGYNFSPGLELVKMESILRMEKVTATDVRKVIPCPWT